MARMTRVLNRLAGGIGGSAALLGLAAASGSWEAASFIVSAAAFARDAIPARAGAALPGSRPALTGRVVIDADGTPKTPTVLCRELGYPDADESVVGHWLRNGGAVEIDGRRVKLRAETVAPAALAGLVDHLMRLPAGPVRVQVYADGWVDELHPSPRAALARIGDAIAAAGHPAGGERFHYVSAPVEQAPEGKARALLDTWRQCGGRFGETMVTALHEAGLWDGILIVGRARGGDVTRFVHVGERNEAFTAEWRRTAPGQTTAYTPDRDYGPWASAIYRKVLDRMEPHLRHVNARIDRPGTDSIRWPYLSLDLPCLDDAGNAYVLCGAHLSTMAPLRVH